MKLNENEFQLLDQALSALGKHYAHKAAFAQSENDVESEILYSNLADESTKLAKRFDAEMQSQILLAASLYI